MSDSAVNHPLHYQSEDGIECIDAIRAALTPEEFRGFLRGNSMKYEWRAEKKGDPVEDIDKAMFYLGMAKLMADSRDPSVQSTEHTSTCDCEGCRGR